METYLQNKFPEISLRKFLQPTPDYQLLAMEKVKSTWPPSLSFIGIEDGMFISQADGFGGTIKMGPEDFIVRIVAASTQSSTWGRSGLESSVP